MATVDQVSSPPRASHSVQSVELLLDPDAERRVLRVWRALDDAGLPSQAHHSSPSNRPHVTLVATRDLPADADARLPALAADLPVAGEWGAVAEFGTGPWTVVRLVEPTAGMRALQARVAAVCAVPGDSLSAPGRWRAHVTFARRVGPDDLPQVRAVTAAALAEADREGQPVWATGVRRWDGSARRDWLLTPP